MMNDELLTIDEVAKVLKVHKSHIFRLMKEGELPIVKRGNRYTRILRSDLGAFIQKHRVEPNRKGVGK
jgi:excisionase family DNA binding protein